MKKSKDVESYAIGCDMGTGSFGWCVTDENGELVSFRHQPMWGVRLFETGKTAEERRQFRSTRRRLARRVQRLQWLRDLLGSEVEKVDPDFFKRLQYSSVSPHDSQWEALRELFASDGYCSNLYEKKYPTIYHLRKALAEETQKADFRLIYLAIHHIIKYRGNFLHEGEMQIHGGVDLKSSVSALLSLVIDGDTEISEAVSSITDTLKDEKKSAFDKQKVIQIALQSVTDDQDKKFCAELSKAILGRSADYTQIFPTLGEKKISVSLDDEAACEQFSENLGDTELEVFQVLQKLYADYTLAMLLSGNVSTISDVYINRYNQHAQDLRTLKRIVRAKCPHETYHDLFNGKQSWYERYRLNNSKDSSYDNLIKSIKKILESIENSVHDDDVSYCMKRIEEGEFLKKPKSSENGAIPNQLHCEELKAILDHQKRFYPVLAENEQKLLQIASYRIPYYVGPLSPQATKYGWAQRKEQGPVTPWNFTDKIDVMASAERFITQRTDTCQFLYGEPVLPKNSLLYGEYCVLNELNGIRLDGKRLSVDVKQQIFHELFQTQKTVTKGTLSKWLYEHRYASHEKGLDLTGFQKEDEFASNLSSWIDFSRIFGGIREQDKEMIENLILWNTLFTDKKILKAKIRKSYPKLADSKVASICKLNYQGWGRLSQKLLTGLSTVDAQGRVWTVMDLLWETNQLFMEIIFDETYGFQQRIETANKQNRPETSLDAYDTAFPDVPMSPSVKKSAWQGLQVIREIVQVMGKEPKRIYVEFTRGDEEKKRTISRYYALEKIYKRLKDDPSFEKVYEELTSRKEEYKKQNGPLKIMRLYLYFLQNGKCMYSGQPLDIQRLGDYQIDHILPQAYIKNNSIDNLVLVKSKENQRKRDSLLLDDTIITKQKPFWKTLRKNGLISSKKFHALIREEVSENDFNGFINRQIVETSQAVKILSDVLKEAFPTTTVMGIKAGLSHDFRAQNGLYKIREVNDYHHAHDALLACQVGRFLAGPFGQMVKNKEALIDFQNALQDDTSNARDEKYGFVIHCMSREYGSWHGYAVVEYLRKVFGYHHYFLSRKTEEMRGAFYNQMLMPKGEKGGATVPSKEGKDFVVYGGYSGENLAHFDIIEYSKGKKRYRKLVGIPIRIIALEETQKGAVTRYLSSLYKDPVVIKAGIRKYQYIRYPEKDGSLNEFYIVSDGEVINARELILSQDTIAHLALFDRLEVIEKQKLFGELCDKMKKYPCYRGIAENLLLHVGDFGEMNSLQQKKCIQGILVYMQANSSRFDFGKEFGASWKNVSSNRLIKSLDPNQIEFIDHSVTGMYERRYHLGLSNRGDHKTC
jgi:CRISPR-associated endonuclease Csn1